MANFEEQQPVESNENFSNDDSTSSSLSDSLSKDLYSDLSIFNNGSKSTSGNDLPDLQLGDWGNDQLAMASPYAEQGAMGDKGAAGAKGGAGSGDKAQAVKAESSTNPLDETFTYADRDAAMTKSGMQHDASQDHNNAKVYTPGNGQAADKHGRTKVQLIEQNGQMQYEITDYANGNHKSTEYGNDGKVTSETTTTPDGKSITRFPGVNGDAGTMAKAYAKDGAAGLKAEIDSIIKQGGNWSQVDKMLKEMDKNEGIKTYTDANNNLKVSEWGFDSTVTAKPAAPAPQEKAPESKPGTGWHPAVNALPNLWTKEVNGALNGKK